MSPSKNTQFGYIENIILSTVSTTVTTSPPPFASKYLFGNTIQAMFDKFDKISDRSDEIFDKQH